MTHCLDIEDLKANQIILQNKNEGDISEFPFIEDFKSVLINLTRN